jgi:hypothetical protein
MCHLLLLFLVLFLYLAVYFSVLLNFCYGTSSECWPAYTISMSAFVPLDLMSSFRYDAASGVRYELLENRFSYSVFLSSS